MRVSKSLALAIAVVMAVLGAACDSDETAGLRVMLSAEPTSIAVNDQATITAQVMNDTGQPVAGVVITWGTNFGSLASQSSSTDADGRCTAFLSGTGTAGIATVTATTGTGRRGEVTVRIG